MNIPSPPLNSYLLIRLSLALRYPLSCVSHWLQTHLHCISRQNGSWVLGPGLQGLSLAAAEHPPQAQTRRVSEHNDAMVMLSLPFMLCRDVLQQRWEPCSQRPGAVHSLLLLQRVRGHPAGADAGALFSPWRL